MWKEHFYNLLGTLLKLQINVPKILILGQKMTKHSKKVNCENPAGLDEMPTEISNKMKFEDLLLRLRNMVYKQNTTEMKERQEIFLGITRNYREIALSAIAANPLFFFTLLLNRTRPDIKKTFKKLKWLLEKLIHKSKILTIHLIIEGVSTQCP